MSMKWGLLLTGLIVVFLSACSSPTGNAIVEVDGIECEPPLKKFGDDCCLDKNNNYICDEEEYPEETKEREETPGLEEIQKIATGERLMITEGDLPVKVQMQRDTRILYTVNGEEEVMILRDIDEFRVTFHYESNRFKINEGRTLPVGSLLITFEGLNPPKGGNAAELTLQPFYNP